MINIFKSENSPILLSILVYLSFFLGFIFNENSIGSGGYTGDLNWMWKNFDIFKNNSLWASINHPEFFGNRTPLLYVLHILFNPFITDIYSYRISVFCISFFAPIIFYIYLIEKFKGTDKKLLFLISSLILLSPFYRTSAFWGLEINYGIISMLLSLSILEYTFSVNRKKNLNLYFLLILLTFTSSICVYFDQKLLIIPLLILFKILKAEIQFKFKFYTILNYSIFSIPFLYLLFTWKGIVPPSTQLENPNTVTAFSRLDSLWFEHLGYATTIIAFYIFPIIFFRSKDLFDYIKNFFSKKINIITASLFLIYLYYLITFFNYQEFTVEEYSMGLGYIHKVSILLFQNLFYQEIFTFIAFFISWLIVIMFIENNFKNFLILIYFYILSLLLWPLMQEYFDPIIFLFAFTVFSGKLFINFKNCIYLFFYLSIFLICANFYYL